MQHQELRHESLTLTSLRGDTLPDMKAIVDTSHFWMSDHSRFWYHLEANRDIYNLGAVLISDTGKNFLGKVEKSDHCA